MDRVKIGEQVTDANGVVITMVLWSNGDVTWDKIILRPGEVIYPRG